MDKKLQDFNTVYEAFENMDRIARYNLPEDFNRAMLPNSFLEWCDRFLSHFDGQKNFVRYASENRPASTELIGFLKRMEKLHNAANADDSQVAALVEFAQQPASQELKAAVHDCLNSRHSTICSLAT